MSADAAAEAAAAPAVAAEPAPASAPQQHSSFSVVFEAGPLGLSLGDDRSIGKVVADSQAARGGVEVGDCLVRVNDASIVDLPPAEVLNAIKAAGRPMTLTFERAPPVAAAPTPASSGRSSLIAAVLGGAGIPSVGAGAAAGGGVAAPAAKDVAKKAGAFMRGVLSTSAQVFSAVDKVIDRAIDDSTKRVAHAAKTTARDISATGKRASLQISASLAVTKGGVDIRRLRARSGSSGSIALGDADAGFDGLHALHRLQQERLAVLRSNNEAVMALADEVDGTLRDARAHTARLQGEYAALQAAAGALPAITADLRAACDRAAHLKELMTALEGKLTGAALAKVDREHAAWVAAAERSVDDHARSREAQVASARLRAQDVASRFVANTGGVADAIMAAMVANAAAGAPSAAGGAGESAASDASASEQPATDAAPAPTKTDEQAAATVDSSTAAGDAPATAAVASPAQSPQTSDAPATTPASAPASAASTDASPVAAPAGAAALEKDATVVPPVVAAAEPAAAAASPSDTATAAATPAAAAAADTSVSTDEAAGAAAKAAPDAKKGTGKGGKAGKKGGKDDKTAATAADTEIDETTGKPLVRGQSVRVKDLAKLYDPSAKQ